jgi:hypothetical protein
VSCSRSYEIDIAAFLEDASAPELAEFREHYPVCAECAAEVRAWTDLDALLRAARPQAADDHPAPARLLAYRDESAAVDPAERERIARHLAGCPSCRDELGALGTWDAAYRPAAVVSAADAPPLAYRVRPGLAREPSSPGRRRLADWLARLRDLVLHPAFAYALVLLLLYPAVTGVLERSVPTGEGLLEEYEALEPAAQTLERKRAERSDAPEELREQLRVFSERLGAPEPAELRERAAAKSAPAPATAPAPAGAVAGDASEIDAFDDAALRGFAAAAQEAEVPAPSFRVAIPDEIRAAPGFEVRVRHPDGRRELRWRFAAAEAGPVVDLPLPPDWPTGESLVVQVLALPSAPP